MSCADTVPRISSVRNTVIFDYKFQNSLAQMRLAVFVQPFSDAARVKSMEITDIQSGLVWQITDVRLVGNGSSLWAGCPYMVPVYDGLIPAGAYELTYIDAADRFEYSRFTVAYPAQLAQTRADSVKSVLGPTAKEKIALYSELNGEGMLIYYGPAKKEWQDTSLIPTDYPDAASLRKIVETVDVQVMCLLPPENLKQ